MHAHNICYMEVVCCSASLGWACVMAGLHNHLLAHTDLKDKVVSFNSGDRAASDADRWQAWLLHDSPRVLADTFCAVLAAMLLDGTWFTAYHPMRILVERYALRPQRAGVDLPGLHTAAANTLAEPVPWASLDQSMAERLWQDAVDRNIVASLSNVAPGSVAELDDLHVVRLPGTGHPDRPLLSLCTGSCPQTAQLRAVLYQRLGTAHCHVSCPPAPLAPPEPDLQLQTRHCSFCNVTMKSLREWHQHCNGHRHRTKASLLQWQEPKKRAPEPTQGKSQADLHLERPDVPGSDQEAGGSCSAATSTLRADVPEFVPDFLRH